MDHKHSATIARECPLRVIRDRGVPRQSRTMSASPRKQPNCCVAANDAKCHEPPKATSVGICFRFLDLTMKQRTPARIRSEPASIAGSTRRGAAGLRHRDRGRTQDHDQHRGHDRHAGQAGRRGRADDAAGRTLRWCRRRVSTLTWTTPLSKWLSTPAHLDLVDRHTQMRSVFP